MNPHAAKGTETFRQENRVRLLYDTINTQPPRALIVLCAGGLLTSPADSLLALLRNELQPRATNSDPSFISPSKPHDTSRLHDVFGIPALLLELPSTLSPLDHGEIVLALNLAFKHWTNIVLVIAIQTDPHDIFFDELAGLCRFLDAQPACQALLSDVTFAFIGEHLTDRAALAQDIEDEFGQGSSVCDLLLPFLSGDSEDAWDQSTEVHLLNSNLPLAGRDWCNSLPLLLPPLNQQELAPPVVTALTSELDQLLATWPSSPDQMALTRLRVLCGLLGPHLSAIKRWSKGKLDQIVFEMKEVYDVYLQQLPSTQAVSVAITSVNEFRSVMAIGAFHELNSVKKIAEEFNFERSAKKTFAAALEDKKLGPQDLNLTVGNLAAAEKPLGLSAIIPDLHQLILTALRRLLLPALDLTTPRLRSGFDSHLRSASSCLKGLVDCAALHSYLKTSGQPMWDTAVDSVGDVMDQWFSETSTTMRMTNVAALPILCNALEALQRARADTKLPQLRGRLEKGLDTLPLAIMGEAIIKSNLELELKQKFVGMIGALKAGVGERLREDLKKWAESNTVGSWESEKRLPNLTPPANAMVKLNTGSGIVRFIAPMLVEMLLKEVRKTLQLLESEPVELSYVDTDGDDIMFKHQWEYGLAFKYGSTAASNAIRVSCRRLDETPGSTPTELSVEEKVEVADSKFLEYPAEPTKAEENEWISKTPPHARKNRIAGKLKTGKKAMGVFVGHMTFPDGAQVHAKEPFTKVWRVENHSVNPWPPGSELRPVGVNCNLLGAPEAVKVDSQDLAKPGYYCDVKIPFVAPTERGIYMSYWRLSDPRGTRFGERLRVKVQVI